MTVVAAIAVNVFRESVRDKVLYNLVLFAVLLMAASYVIGQLTVGQDIKIIKDLGLAAIAIFGLLIAVFIGIGLVSKEVERRSIYSLLAKPIRRDQFLLAKYLGLLLTLAVNVAAMSLALYGVLAVLDWTHPELALLAPESPVLDPALLKAITLILGELSIVTACALLFSTFSTPMLSAALTFGLYIAGHFNAELRQLHTVISSPAAASIGRALYYLLPNLAAFDVKTAVVHGQAVPPGYIGLTLAYGAAYIAALLFAATLVFTRRDFK